MLSFESIKVESYLRRNIMKRLTVQRVNRFTLYC